MTPHERDNEQLGIILRYCKRMDEALALLGDGFEAFEGNPVLQDSCSLCLMQIGEAVNRLSGDFRKSNPQIEWTQIHGLRCRYVHGDEMFDAEIVWDAIENEIPPLHAFCEERFVK